jgi:hypothetical protein
MADTSPPGSATYPAPFPAPPQVTNSGGGVLANPVIVAIFFNNDDPTSISTYSQFYQGLVGTKYGRRSWNTVSGPGR